MQVMQRFGALRGTVSDPGLAKLLHIARRPDAGIPSVDIIDLNYGPGNSYHHTTADTLDKISADSMEKVGKVVLAMLPALQK